MEIDLSKKPTWEQIQAAKVTEEAIAQGRGVLNDHGNVRVFEPSTGHHCAYCGPLAEPHPPGPCPLVHPDRVRMIPPETVRPHQCSCATTINGHDEGCVYHFVPRDWEDR